MGYAKEQGWLDGVEPLESLLNRTRDSFVKWRYFFEGEKDPRIGDLQSLDAALLECAMSESEEWKKIAAQALQTKLEVPVTHNRPPVPTPWFQSPVWVWAEGSSPQMWLASVVYRNGS